MKIRAKKDIKPWFTKHKVMQVVKNNKVKKLITVINDNGDPHEITEAWLRDNFDVSKKK